MAMNDDENVKTINLTDTYNARIIEGIDEYDLEMAIIDNKNDDNIFEYNSSGIVRHKASGVKITIDCISKYYQPKKPYYRMDEKSSCKYIQNAVINREIGENNCNKCFLICMNNDIPINK